MKITPFAVAGLLVGVSSLAYGLLVLFKSQNKKIGRIWCLFSLSTAGWGLGCLLAGLTTTPQVALWAWRFGYGVGVIWIATFFFHFVCVFCDFQKPKLLPLHYLFSFFYSCIIPTDYFYFTPRLMFGSLYVPTYKPHTYLPFFFLWMTSVFYSHYLLWKSHKTSIEPKKTQIKYFFIGTAVGYFGGCQTYLPNFGVEIYPWGNFAVCLYPLIMSYAIIRYNLMDIRILVRKTALIIGVYLVLLVAIAPVLYFFHVHNRGAASESILAFEVLLISGILSTGPFLYAFMVRRSSFFQEYTLAGITHELKSPLSVIEGALEHLTKVQKLPNSDPQQIASYLEMIQRNSSRLQGFVNELLQTFHLDSTQAAIVREKTNLTKLIRDVVHSFSASAQSKNIEIRFHAARESQANIDPLKIRQVVSNILLNAMKFSDSGIISIRTKESEKEITIEVNDEGQGIAYSDLPYVFDRFYQGKNGRSRKGTGLGLTIAKTWVEAHGGKIWAESEGEGKGAKVTFTLPIDK